MNTFSLAFPKTVDYRRVSTENIDTVLSVSYHVIPCQFSCGNTSVSGRVDRDADYQIQLWEVDLDVSTPTNSL